MQHLLLPRNLIRSLVETSTFSLKRSVNCLPFEAFSILFSQKQSESSSMESLQISVRNININEQLQALIAPAILPRSFLSLQVKQNTLSSTNAWKPRRTC